MKWYRKFEKFETRDIDERLLREFLTDLIRFSKRTDTNPPPDIFEKIAKYDQALNDILDEKHGIPQNIDEHNAQMRRGSFEPREVETGEITEQTAKKERLAIYRKRVENGEAMNRKTEIGLFRAVHRREEYAGDVRILQRW